MSTLASRKFRVKTERVKWQQSEKRLTGRTFLFVTKLLVLSLLFFRLFCGRARSLGWLLGTRFLFNVGSHLFYERGVAGKGEENIQGKSGPLKED
jgi:hypothetical protein